MQRELLQRLLYEALQRPSGTRETFLDERCANDPEARTTLQQLLIESGESDPILKAGGAFDGPLWTEIFEEPAQLVAGARLGPYEIRDALGAGGMGEVYRAHDTRLARDVAIKILPSDALVTNEAVARFEREARAVAALNHPNILAIHDVGSAGRIRFVVTELLEGETLRQRLSGGPLTANKAVEYGIEIARGLAAAHDRGIVHRDMKPENLFITRDGRVKILDFGIALYEESNASRAGSAALTRSGAVLGTVGYTSPEQMRGKLATAQSDLFGLGIVMHEMLTGVHPFVRATAPETQAAVLRDAPPTLLRSTPNVAPAIVRLVERCLQKQPADRPETARDVALFLEIVSGVEDAGPAARDVVGFESGRQLRTRLLMFSCGLVLLLSAMTWGYVRVVSDRTAREVLENNFARGERSVQRLHAEQLTRLGLTARLVSSFPELRALFATDVATVEDFLLGYQQRIANTPVLVALGPDGTVLGRTGDAGPATAGEEWLASLLPAQNEGAVVSVGNRPYLAVAVASEAAGTVFGYLVAAEPINQMFAAAVSEATQDEVVLLSHDRVLGSTLRAEQTPWPSLEAWRAQSGRTDRSADVRIGSLRFAVREIILTSEPAVSVLLVKSREDVVGPYARVERGVLISGLLAVAAAVWGSFWFARRHTKRA